jgi:hypothetical protein
MWMQEWGMCGSVNQWAGGRVVACCCRRSIVRWKAFLVLDAEADAGAGCMGPLVALHATRSMGVGCFSGDVRAYTL